MIFLLLLACSVASADYKPPNGTENFYSFLSPSFYAGSIAATRMQRPPAELLNPAISGLSQIPAYEISYLTLFDAGGEQRWGAHMLNLGGSHPTRIGVLGWGARFFSSRMESFDTGTVGEIDLSLSKPINDRLLVGLGLGGGVCTNDKFDWALSGDIGFLHFLSTDLFPEVRWGVSFRNLGKMYVTKEGRSAYPSPFTPLVSLGVGVVNTRSFDLDANGSISLPSFQNVRVGLGFEMSFFDTVGVSVSSTYDLREIVDPDIERGSFIPNFGLSVRFGTDIRYFGKKEREPADMQLQAAAGPVTDTVWGVGLGLNGRIGRVDEIPPKITVSCPEDTVLSLSDGHQKSITLDVDIEDERYIYGYSFEVEDALGNTVRTVQSTLSRPGGAGLGGVIGSLGYVYSSIQIPKSFIWDGRSDAGTIVSDGTYVISVSAWDDNGNFAESRKCLVEVDSTAPAVFVEPLSDLERIFSPNNDGNKDTILIEQTGSIEDLWIGTICRDEKVVRTYTWEDGKPESFVWDGVGDDGTLASDGIYSYEIRAVDRAGNIGKAALEEIVLNSQVTRISLTIDKSHFSPNGDGRHDEILLSANVPITSGIRRWSMAIEDTSGKVVRRYTGQSELPVITRFDGYGDNGKVVPEGRYTAVMEVTYINGNNPKSRSPQFTLDITPPEASVTADYAVFSPDGDGNKDVITFFQEASVEQEWTGEIYTAEGLAINRYFWRGQPDRTVRWDGHGIGGLIAPNGTYSYRIFAEDKAGNRGGSRELLFELNTKAASVRLSRELEAISPNADGSQDAQRFLPQVSTDQGIDSYTLWVLNDRDVPVRIFAGRGSLEEYYLWAGLTDEGERVSDGTYYARVEVRYKNGNTPTATSQPFEVDTVFPTISTRASTNLFSPNGDGNKDTVTFHNSTGPEDLWEARIVGPNGGIVRRVFWKGTASSFVWDGTDDAGNLVPDGEYYFEIFTTDAAGNYSIARTPGVMLDTRRTPVIVTAAPERFSPNGDGTLEEITFSTLVTEKFGVISWDLTVAKTSGRVVKRFEGTRIPEKIVWNGRSDTGAIEDGEYIATFEAVYNMGNVPRAQTAPFYIDTTKPEIDLRFGPVPFSPDDDGVDDILEFNVEIRDMSEIEKWSLTIVNPRGDLFRQYQGTGSPPSRIYWNGVSADGELVLSAEEYPFELYVEDAVGNSDAVLNSIPVGILVLEENEGFRIQTSGFLFEPNRPELESDNADAIAKNEWILGRLAEICRKCANYYIIVEGHAVSIYWNDADRAEFEQENQLVPLTKARADTIRDALIALGIDGERIETEGVGGADPAVPHDDIENRWKNKRIEIILHK